MRTIILLAFGLVWAVSASAQVGSSISADGSAPNVNAMLDVQSPATGDGKGILIPRVSLAQRITASAALAGGLLDNSGNLRGGAAQGLIVYQTDGAQGLYFNTSQTATPAWAHLGEGADLNMQGQTITNAIYYGDGRGITNIPTTAITESDPRWAAASNAIVADIATRLASNVWTSAGSTTNYLPRTGGTMSGALNMGAQIVSNVSYIDFNGNNVSVGRGANGSDNGAAVGYQANGYQSGVAMGYAAIGSFSGAAMGYSAVGSDNGAAVGRSASGTNYGVAIGYSAAGANSNVAIGANANIGAGGNNRIAIGNNVSNDSNDTARIRGTLHLEGGSSNIYYRTAFQSGEWQVKTFTIDHPLDPENKILRHFCLEGPQVWNVYAGNAQLVNGQAVIELPDYYSALNLVGSEIYSLTPISSDRHATAVIEQEVIDNHFVIGGSSDMKVSWTIKVLRNDPGCREDLQRRPVEQLKNELQAGSE